MTIVCGREVQLPNPQNKLEVIKYVKDFLLAQGERAEIKQCGSQVCAYRTPDGKQACAAGCLIPDEEYNKEWESTSIFMSDAVGRYFSEKNYDLLLLRAMQNIHDGYSPETWSRLFSGFEKFIENGGEICRTDAAITISKIAELL